MKHGQKRPFVSKQGHRIIYAEDKAQVLYAQDQGAGYELILTSDIKALKAGSRGF